MDGRQLMVGRPTDAYKPYIVMMMVMVVDITVSFIIWIFVTILRSYEFEVDNPVDGKDIKEEETMEVVDIRMYHFSAEIVHL